MRQALIALSMLLLPFAAKGVARDTGRATADTVAPYTYILQSDYGSFDEQRTVFFRFTVGPDGTTTFEMNLEFRAGGFDPGRPMQPAETHTWEFDLRPGSVKIDAGRAFARIDTGKQLGRFGRVAMSTDGDDNPYRHELCGVEYLGEAELYGTFDFHTNIPGIGRFTERQMFISFERASDPQTCPEDDHCTLYTVLDARDAAGTELRIEKAHHNAAFALSFEEDPERTAPARVTRELAGRFDPRRMTISAPMGRATFTPRLGHLDGRLEFVATGPAEPLESYCGAKRARPMKVAGGSIRAAFPTGARRNFLAGDAATITQWTAAD